MVLLAVALLAASLCFGAPGDPSQLPSIFDPRSTPTKWIYHLSYFVLSITGLIFVVVFALLFYAVVKFRKRPGDDSREPAQVYGSNQIELAWTVIPILIVVVLFLATARVIHSIQDVPKPENAVEVVAIGHQFWWEFRYPQLGVVTANELHIPVSEAAHATPTFLTLLSADTDHSFWVPQLAGKTDLIPNRVNHMWMDPYETGIFLGQCAQYCGTQHAKMLLRVYVDSPEEFATWVRAPKSAGSARRECNRRQARFRNNGLHKLPRDWGHSRKWTLRPGPDAPDEPPDNRIGCGRKYKGEPSLVDSETRCHQTGFAHACYATQQH